MSALKRTNICLAEGAAGRMGAVKVAEAEYRHNMPILQAMRAELQNSLNPTGPQQATPFTGSYRDCFGDVWDSGGNNMPSAWASAYSDIENARDADNGIGSSLTSVGIDAGATVALTAVNPALGAGYAAISAVTGIFGIGNNQEKLLARVNANIEAHEEIRIAAAAKMNANFNTNDDNGKDSPRFEGYRMAENAPKTPQPMMGMPAPSMA